jgi:hypothetical protein
VNRAKAYSPYSFWALIVNSYRLFLEFGPRTGCVRVYGVYMIVQFFMNLNHYIRALTYFVQSVQSVQSTKISRAHASRACTPIKESCTDRKMMLKSTLFNPLSPDLCYKPP